jgi:hypothetical protein
VFSDRGRRLPLSDGGLDDRFATGQAIREILLIVVCTQQEERLDRMVCLLI